MIKDLVRKSYGIGSMSGIVVGLCCEKFGHAVTVLTMENLRRNVILQNQIFVVLALAAVIGAATWFGIYQRNRLLAEADKLEK